MAVANLSKAEKTILVLRKKGLTFISIAKELNKKGIKPNRARKWSTNNVQHHFYKNQ